MHETKIDISFIVPAYNEEGLLGDCLNSIKKEAGSLPEIKAEIIVVNNASTDNTKTVALSFPGVIVVDEPKKGLVNARAAGAKAARGEILAHIDADCRLPAGWLKRVMDEFSADKSLVAISGPYQYYDFTAWQNFLVKMFYWLGYPFYIVSRFVTNQSSMLQGGNIAVKKSAWEKIGAASPEFNFYGEDTDLARRLNKIGPVKFRLDFINTTSGRRLKKEGIVRSGWRYFMNYLSVVLFNKPATKTYTDIRSH